jgi:hypothetical protein
MTDEIQDLQALREELAIAKKKVTALQQQMKQLEDVVYARCIHVWRVDYSNVGEHTEHVCTKCNLSKK